MRTFTNIKFVYLILGILFTNSLLPMLAAESDWQYDQPINQSNLVPSNSANLGNSEQSPGESNWIRPAEQTNTAQNNQSGWVSSPSNLRNAEQSVGESNWISPQTTTGQLPGNSFGQVSSPSNYLPAMQNNATTQLSNWVSPAGANRQNMPVSSTNAIPQVFTQVTNQQSAIQPLQGSVSASTLTNSANMNMSNVPANNSMSGVATSNSSFTDISQSCPSPLPNGLNGMLGGAGMTGSSAISGAITSMMMVPTMMAAATGGMFGGGFHNIYGPGGGFRTYAPGGGYYTNGPTYGSLYGPSAGYYGGRGSRFGGLGYFARNALMGGVMMRRW